MENILDVLACDVGYHGVKAAYRSRGFIEAFSYPSVVSRISRETLRSTTEFLGKNSDCIEVTVGETSYVVDTSKTALPSSSTVRTEVDNFPRTDQYTALILASIKKIGAFRIKCLVLGLPLHTMSKHTDYLKSRFATTHNFGEFGKCVVEKVVVLPQPLGAFARLRGQGLISAERVTSTCVVDVGWHTTDTVVINPNGTPDLERSVGLPRGAAHVVREVTRLIGEKTGTRVDNIDRVDYALRTGERLQIGGEPVDLAPFLRTALLDTHQVADAVLTAIKTCEDLEVFVSGGGARFYADALSKAIGFRAKLVDGSHMVNAFGFLAAAEAALGARGAW